MIVDAEPTDAEVLAKLTDTLPLARYCVIAGRVRSWVKLKSPSGGDWLPLTMLIENNLLARCAPGALLRAGVPSFDSDAEAAVWVRTQEWAA